MNPPTYHWPFHWNTPNGNVRCIVFACHFITYAATEYDKMKDLLEHCEDQCDGNHKVMVHILRQRRCVHEDCSYSRGTSDPWRVRLLFEHEIIAHNDATSMSHIESFVTLIRQERVRMANLNDVKKAVFQRMEEMLHFTGNTMILIYRMGGYPHPADQTPENLREILSPQTVQRGAPYWEPLPSYLFLMNIAPGADAPADDLWRVLWTQLRLMYAGGRI